MLYIIDDINQVSVDLWSDFVINHEYGNFFQSHYAYSLYRDSKNYTPFGIFCFESNILVGLLTGTIISEGNGIISFLTSRSIIAGGPLVSNNRVDIIECLIDHYIKKFKKKVIYTQIQNLFEVKELLIKSLNHKFKYIPHYDIHISLKTELDEFFNSLKPKLRQNIRKTEKLGVEISFATASDINEIYLILVEVYSNAKLPIPPISLIESAFNNLIPDNKILPLIAKIDNKIIGFRIGLLYKDIIFDWYAGSLTNYYKYNTNDYLPYKTIEWGIKNPEFNLFDFGGAGKPNIPYGVREHKLKFSSNLLILGRHEYIHKKLLYYSMSSLFKIYKNMKKYFNKNKYYENRN